jgi:glycosyltransferase involved in cell wall biosynthesis
MKTSIVLATYNGERYLSKQLESLISQTLPFDELIIIDDASNDSTIDIIKKYSKVFSNIKFFINSNNVGWRQNFFNGLKYVNNDIIFFCDQDDIWEKDKLKIMVEVFKNNPKVLVLHSGLRQINHNDKQIMNVNMRKFEFFQSSRVLHIPFDKSFQYQNAPGCLIAIRRLLLINLKYIDIDIPHDNFFFKLGILMNGAYIVEKNLINYRIHGLNSSGSSNLNLYGKVDITKRIKNIEIINCYLKLFLEICNKLTRIDFNKKAILKSSIIFNGYRVKFLK